MDSKKISVIVTTYNNEKHIKECINSILAQSHKNFEIIIIDDNSKDLTLEKIKELQDRRIKLIALDINVGVSSARNIGIQKSTGDYITQVDGDDFINKDKLFNELKTCEKFGGGAYSEHILVDETGKILRSAFKYHKKRKNISEFAILMRAQAFGRDWMVPSNVAKKIYYNETYALYEDWDYKLRVTKQVKFFFSYSIGTYYRQTKNGLSKQPPHKHIAALLHIFDKNCDYKNTYLARKIFSINARSGYLSKASRLLLDYLS